MAVKIKEEEKSQAFQILSDWYGRAEELVNSESYYEEDEAIGRETALVVHRLGKTNHAARGAALTLCLSQVLRPDLDTRNHKAEFGDGFSARGIDEVVTVLFLKGKGLPYRVQSHWMTRTLANDTPYWPSTVLKTVPKSAGPDLITTANFVYESRNDCSKLEAIGTILLIELIRERNLGRIPVTRPKGLSIDKVMFLLHSHFNVKYKKNAPRLPQIAMYAIYKCLMASVNRYDGLVLEPLQKMKSADRKSGTFGDVVVSDQNGRPQEAVEIKFEIPIDQSIVAEAIQKVQSQSVERYFILSTVPPKSSDMDEIQRMKDGFLKSNGCEIIVNGVYDTIKYYLRMLKSTNEFINNYVDLLENDVDLNYEHKVAWNACCEKL